MVCHLSQGSVREHKEGQVVKQTHAYGYVMDRMRPQYRSEAKVF